MPLSKWIHDWKPEDATFWRDRGRFVARRNLFWSIVAEHIGFSVWMMWSVTVPRLTKAGFPYTQDQLFMLVAIPALVGAFMRIPYTFAVSALGGRNWTVISALLLTIPTVLMAVLVGRPDTPYGLMVAAAASAGLGGGNFASSMANISFFYPDKQKGFALGINAAGGNIGVSTVQLLAPLVIGFGLWHQGPARVRLENIGLIWLPLIVIAALGAWLFMDNLAGAKTDVSKQIAVAKRKHTWIISLLYIATFGSFVGFSAAFPLLLKMQFPATSLGFTFVGALVGSVARPLGGLLADKIGGARVTFWTFLVMGGAAFGVSHFVDQRNLVGFLAMFLLLFASAGVGNGSTFRMIPVIFRVERVRSVARRGAEVQGAALDAARRDCAAVLGFSSAIGALGGYLIPTGFGASIRATGGPGSALTLFITYYAVCSVLTWWYYRRRTFLTDLAPSLASSEA